MTVKAAIDLLAEVLQMSADEICEEDTIETLEKWDSLNHMRMILAIEDKYRLQVDPDIALSLFTIRDIADFLEKQT